MQHRQATAEEILAHKAFDIRRGVQVSYRHFVREIYNPRAENGVSHRQYSRSHIRVIEGKPHVMHLGEIQEITGDLVTLDTGRQFVGDLRIKSEYLPSVLGPDRDPHDEPICDKYATAGVAYCPAA